MIRFITPLAIVGFLAAYAVYGRAPSAATAAPLVDERTAPPTTREAWAVELLRRLGNAQPSADTVALVVAWTRAEDSGPGAGARNNYLNTTLCLPDRMTGAINGDGACGVQGYATWQDGIEATARTIEQANMAGIRAALLANDADGARAAIWAAPWAESHYNWGANWPGQ